MATGLAWYLDEIGRHPLLTPAEEIELGTAVQAWLTHPEPVPPGIRRRGQRARDRFVAANLRLAVNFVTKRCHRLIKKHSTEDLIQAANLGLIKAVERFDPTRGYKFSTYACWWLHQSVSHYCAKHGRTITIPGLHSEHLGRLQPTTRRLRSELGRDPTSQELAAGLGVSMAVFEQLLVNAKRVESLDLIIGDGIELGDLVAAHDPTLEQQEEQQERWRQAEQLRQVMRQLPAADRQLLTRAYGLDGQEASRQELAAELGLSSKALNRRLSALEQQLASLHWQLVLVSVEPAAPARLRAPPARRRRRLKDYLQLSLWQADHAPWRDGQLLAA